jgi:hypothetical protein
MVTSRIASYVSVMTERRVDLVEILARSSSAQIWAWGKETAAVLLEQTRGATIVSMGDAAMPRRGALQDLELVVFIDGELVVYEVKTRHASRLAGRLTKAGNLTRPRLRRRPRPSVDRQASQGYVAARLVDTIDVTDGYEGVEVRVMAVDFRLMMAQEFVVDDRGSTMVPAAVPLSCNEAAGTALARIIDHRGHL